MFARACYRASARSSRCSATSFTRPNAGFRAFGNFSKRPQPHAPRFPGAGGRNASIFTGFRGWAGAKKLFKQYPFQTTAAVFFIVFGFGVHIYAPFFYQNYIRGAFHNYPEEVAKKLRRALYFSQERSLSPRDAVKYYREALEVADQIGMDPFSDEILGIKFQLATFFEKLQNHQRAIDVLEIVKRDCLLWVEMMGDKHWNDGKRTRVLGKTIGISVKLGDLYTNQYVQRPEKAEEVLVWAVTTVLKEKARREKEGVKEGEGEWINDEQMGASMEALAHHYEERNQHYLATPLFLQALTHSPPKSCHSVVLMNNLAQSLSQQLPPSSPQQPAPPAQPSPPTRAALASNARQWATKAIALAASIAPPNRTEECDLGCAVATHNLAMLEEMSGNFAAARKRYEEAGSLAKAIGFGEGVQMAEEGLRGLGGKETSKAGSA